MSEPLILHTKDLPWEGWDESQLPTRGHILWKTLFSQGATPTDSLTGGIALVRPGHALEPHHHEPSEIYYLIRGEAIVTLGQQEHVVQGGDAVFIPGNVRHGIANHSSTDVLFFYAFARDSFNGIVYHFPYELD